MLPVLLALAIADTAGAVSGVPAIHDGRAGALRVTPPRVETSVTVDGLLDEPVWQQAAVLTGFSQFSPADGIPAADTTEVLVWYSPSAIHFGIRAREGHGPARATLADRDRISGDDNVTIFLGTFNDGRQATVLAVNPLGVQADGVLNETGQRGTSGFGTAPVARENADLNPDFVWQSKGRLTDWGYEVEIRVPFKSLRYLAGERQTWGINVVRRVQHSGFEDSWAPAKRASPTFIGQSGSLEGLTGLRRGLVFDATPTITETVAGAPLAPGGAWRYDARTPDLGLTLRWGVTNNLTVNGAVNPDFSQVEADAGQIAFDPRQALFFPERRPFFLDGIEQFQTPNQLVYTRRIVQPVAAVKLAGKALGSNIALLSAVDDRGASATGSNPVFTIVRFQRDVGKQSRLGVLYTDRLDGGNYNRVANVDGRLVFATLWSLQFQGAASRTRTGSATTAIAPLWDLRLNRDGRALNLRYAFIGLHPDFRSQSGFVRRPGIARVSADQRYTVFGGQRDFVQNVIAGVYADAQWRYVDFTGGGASQDRKLHLNLNTALRGGWTLGASSFIESFGFDPDLYRDYRIEAPNAAGGLDTLPFTGTPRLPNLDWVLAIGSPQFSWGAFNGSIIWGRDENFFEWQSGNILFLNASVTLRPTDQLRLEATYAHQQVRRPSDGSLVNIQRIPRLKTEYQLTRWMFVRFVGQFVTNATDALRDDGRTNLPLLIRNPASGRFERQERREDTRFRGDLLFSFQPGPGTVVFAGYGSTLQEPDALRDPGLRRTDDAFFLKLSYLWRL